MMVIRFARQEKSFARFGVELARQRMADWATAVGEALKPVIECLLIELRAGPVLLLDETPVQVHGEEGKKNTSRSYMWVGYGGAPESPVVYYYYAPTRSASAAGNLAQPRKRCPLSQSSTLPSRSLPSGYETSNSLPSVMRW
ncbi:MAG: IS66 family transposase [Spirochaeta sp.]|nr:IS66 family transposase [Spirochaeta sp.]